MTRYPVPMLLRYEDRMSMSHASGVGVPFIDYRFVEWLARVPAGRKLAGGRAKVIFREGLVGPEAVLGLYDCFLAGDSLVSHKDAFNVYCLEIWLRHVADYVAP